MRGEVGGGEHRVGELTVLRDASSISTSHRPKPFRGRKRRGAMPQKIRMWEVTPQNTLSEISSNEISLEERLEDWLASDISMLDPDLLVIGRQVRDRLRR